MNFSNGRSCTGFFLAVVVAFATQLAKADSSPWTEMQGSICDSLLMQGEMFVLSKEELCKLNIHTLDDILRLLPAVSFWREGPESGFGGFSVDGRSSRGINLFVNGLPAIDLYSLRALRSFLPLSRLQRVEVIFGGFPSVAGDVSSQGAINLVIAEGGEEKPASFLDFTYGSSNRRARRVWFSTPKAHISGAFVYDEYLQDGVECIPSVPGRIVGKTDSRSVLSEVIWQPRSEESALLRFQKYEESSVGTLESPSEDVRKSGFASSISYRLSAMQVSLSENALRLDRRSRHVDALSLSSKARFSHSFGPLSIRAFALAQKASFVNAIESISFDPSYELYEGGLSIGGRTNHGSSWRIGGWGGWHEEVGSYAGGEIAFGKAWTSNIYQDFILARRLRIPSAEELYEARALGISDDVRLLDGYVDCLSPEVSEEAAMGIGTRNLYFSVFGRRYASRIVSLSEYEKVYAVREDEIVAGANARANLTRTISGFDCSFAMNCEGFPEREALEDGVASFTFRSNVEIARRVFKETEILSMGIGCEYSGKRSWRGQELSDFIVMDFRSSMTLLSARIKFEIRNLLDERYETVPGFMMPGRYYTVGIVWRLWD